MDTPGVTWAMVGITAAFLITGSTGLVCDTAVESLDLSCLLRWDCPHASPNTTYTVQTKTQGDAWQDVPWCVWISSHSCDVSLVFSNFEVYNMIRLGVHLSPTSTVWIKPRKFDYSDFTFSPPSISVSLKEDQLLVKVQFPCSTNRQCSLGRCCPISKLIDPWTTVSLYSELSPSEHQSRTVWSQEVMSYVEFSGLSPGQNYCVVANFSFPTFSMAASPKSAPQCVEMDSKSELLPILLLGMGLTVLLLFPILTAFLRKNRQAAPMPENQPKSPTSLHDPVTLVPLQLVPVDHCDIHLEVTDDNVSIESSSSLPSNQDLKISLGIKKSNSLLHSHSRSSTPIWDSGALELERHLDSGISIPPVSQSSDETCRTNGD